MPSCFPAVTRRKYRHSHEGENPQDAVPIPVIPSGARNLPVLAFRFFTPLRYVQNDIARPRDSERITHVIPMRSEESPSFVERNGLGGCLHATSLSLE